MTYFDHVLAMKGYNDEVYMSFSMHRRTAYEIYLSRPKAKGTTKLTIQKFMPLPIDSDYSVSKSIETIKIVHSLMLEKLNREKSNEREHAKS